MPYNTMSHVGLEDDPVTKEQLTAMSTSWHYGWVWSGPERPCMCKKASCGLIVTVERRCTMHTLTYGAAKQLHKASECPGDGEQCTS